MSMKIYCSGIGGIGLSAYAMHMLLRGHSVSGSDRTDSALLRDLEKSGVHITTHQDGTGITDDIDLLVYSEAIPIDAPERMAAEKKGIRQMSYFHALGELTAGKPLIAVCGTHGKSSTVSMAALVLEQSGLDPNVIVGTKVPQLQQRNWRKGAEQLWLVEACEYRRSFLSLSPTMIVLTNADGDHFDAFKDASEYEDAFVAFLSLLPPNGVVIAHGDDEQSMRIVRRSGKRCINADEQPLLDLNIPGLHMKKNAQLVQALAQHLALSSEASMRSLQAYEGSWRRMEVKGTKNGITVIDDYAHHPTEIRATLSALRTQYPKRRMICVFQPHTHDRTLKLWKEFASAFAAADRVIVTSIYDARPDTETKRADETLFAHAIEQQSKRPTTFAGNLLETQHLLQSTILKEGDVVVVMGAGDITTLAERLLA